MNQWIPVSFQIRKIRNNDFCFLNSEPLFVVYRKDRHWIDVSSPSTSNRDDEELHHMRVLQDCQFEDLFTRNGNQMLSRWPSNRRPAIPTQFDFVLPDFVWLDDSNFQSVLRRENAHGWGTLYSLHLIQPRIICCMETLSRYKKSVAATLGITGSRNKENGDTPFKLTVMQQHNTWLKMLPLISECIWQTQKEISSMQSLRMYCWQGLSKFTSTVSILVTAVRTLLTDDVVATVFCASQQK